MVSVIFKKMKVLRCFILISCIGLCNVVVGFEFFTAAVVGISSMVVRHSYCKFKECCSEIPGNFTKLEELLEEKLYGQHIVKDILVHALKAHWNPNGQNQKALTMSFHGWPGGGKNYVSNFIKDSLYEYGVKSRHVHHFVGRIHFPLEEKVPEYQENIYNWVKGNVSQCSKQLFIFDEVDKIPATLLNILKPVIDHNENVERVDYRDSIFIFLSNTGGSLITKRLIELWLSGKKREEIQLSDFENLIAYGAFNEKGGFHHADMIKGSLIDHYIPFLPLQERHIRLCILDAFQLRGVENPKPEHIQMVLDYVEWGPSPENLFSKTGCKRLSQKVATIVQKFY